MNDADKIRELIDRLKYYDKCYDEGHPIISDKEYDIHYFDLVNLEKETGLIYPDSPTHMIDYQVKNNLTKVQHNHPMLSADKTKDWDEFLRYFSGKDVIGMVKMDGLTCSLHYINGELVSAETRGNGEIGEDITHNARVVANIPQTISYKNELIVDGEIICKLKDFEPFKDEYKNPRNFAAGSIRLLDAKECAGRNLSFVLWNVIEGFGGNSFLSRLICAEQHGFEVVPYTSSFDWDAKEYLINIAKECGYPIDGLVGRFDDIDYGNSLGATGHHTKAIYAFKFYDEEYETILRDIEWSMGRTGQLTPVAVFDPVEINSNIITRASLHNLSVMKTILGERPYKGQHINIYLSNMIIPQIKGVNE